MPIIWQGAEITGSVGERTTESIQPALKDQDLVRFSAVEEAYGEYRYDILNKSGATRAEVGKAGLTLQRTIKKTILVLLVFMIAIPVIGCSQSEDDAYLSLFDKVWKTWDGPSGWTSGLDPKAIEEEINNIYGKRDINLSDMGSLLRRMEIAKGGTSSIYAIDKWIDEASALWKIRDKGLRESRNYLKLAWESDNLIWAEFDQLVYQQMMASEKLPAEYVKQKVQDMYSTASACKKAYLKAAQLVQDYKKKR